MKLLSLALLFLMAILAAPGEAAPAQHALASMVADHRSIEAGKPFTVAVRIKLDPNWHIYWEYPGESGTPTKVEWKLPPGFKAGPLQYPLPKLEDDGTFHTYVYFDEVLFLTEITPPAKVSGNATIAAKVSWQVCEKICVPGSAELALELPTGQALPANEEVFVQARAQLPKDKCPYEVKWDTSNPKEIHLAVSGVEAGRKIEFFPIPPKGASPEHVTVTDGANGEKLIKLPVETTAAGDWRGLLVEQAGELRQGWYISEKPAAPAAASQVETPPPAKQLNLWSVIGLAFVGGLILNFMPCVLPVIALKIFGFVKQAGQEPQRVFRLGLAFVAGVFTFFLALAALAIALHSAGQSLTWGAQFQNPYLFSGLIALVFVFGLNLLGVFEITLSGETTSTLSELSSREGYGGAFLHGVFTTLLGTSCTAPFLAVSIGYALTQPGPIIFLLFFTTALGMSLPYFLLTARPGWMRFLPKPGLWMERFKQFTGFVMLGVAVWLFTVMATNRPDIATHLLWYLLVLGVACWVFGVSHRAVVRWSLALLLVLGGYFALLHAPLQATHASSRLTKAMPKDGLPWQPYTEERLKAALARGEPVFVDFTADWCANCQVIYKTVLNTDAVRAGFLEKKVTMFVADWSEPDEEIRLALERFGRAGVPLYLLYRPGEPEPVVYDALTPGIVLRELSPIKAAPIQVTQAK